MRVIPARSAASCTAPRSSGSRATSATHGTAEGEGGGARGKGGGARYSSETGGELGAKPVPGKASKGKTGVPARVVYERQDMQLIW